MRNGYQKKKAAVHTQTDDVQKKSGKFVQFKRMLAGMSYAEQKEAVRPSPPVQLRTIATPSAVQFSGGGAVQFAKPEEETCTEQEERCEMEPTETRIPQEESSEETTDADAPDGGVYDEHGCKPEPSQCTNGEVGKDEKCVVRPDDAAAEKKGSFADMLKNPPKMGPPPQHKAVLSKHGKPGIPVTLTDKQLREMGPVEFREYENNMYRQSAKHGKAVTQWKKKMDEINDQIEPLVVALEQLKNGKKRGGNSQEGTNTAEQIQRIENQIRILRAQARKINNRHPKRPNGKRAARGVSARRGQRRARRAMRK